jgi:hypothetical protein
MPLLNAKDVSLISHIVCWGGNQLAVMVMQLLQRKTETQEIR